MAKRVARKVGEVIARCRFCGIPVVYFGDICNDCGGEG